MRWQMVCAPQQRAEHGVNTASASAACWRVLQYVNSALGPALPSPRWQTKTYLLAGATSASVEVLMPHRLTGQRESSQPGRPSAVVRRPPAA